MKQQAEIVMHLREFTFPWVREVNAIAKMLLMLKMLMLVLKMLAYTVNCSAAFRLTLLHPSPTLA